ncbi:MAG: stalk domain-containing protein [Desulfitobacteriaceae bacterium]|nr:stalk domain-containing protein [Desulfitobacteriaceae bacterium]
MIKTFYRYGILVLVAFLTLLFTSQSFTLADFNNLNTNSLAAETILSPGDSKYNHNLDDALFKAAYSGNIQMVNDMIEQGADPNGRSLKGIPILMGALFVNDQQVEPVVNNKGPILAPYPSAKEEEEHLCVLRALLKAGANPNGEGEYVGEPLKKSISYQMWARSSEYPKKYFKALLDAGADHNSDPELMLSAIVQVEPDFIKELLDAGADPNVRFMNGATGLICEVQLILDNGHPTERIEAIKALIASGADPTITDGYGHTALYYANLEESTIFYRDETGYPWMVRQKYPELAKVLQSHIVKEDQQIKVSIDGVRQSYPQPPVIINGRVMVPMRAIFEALGATIGWDGSTQTVTAIKGETRISMQIGAAVSYKGATYFVLGTASSNFEWQNYGACEVC